MVNMALGIVNHDMPDLNVPDRTCLLQQCAQSQVAGILVLLVVV